MIIKSVMSHGFGWTHLQTSLCLTQKHIMESSLQQCFPSQPFGETALGLCVMWCLDDIITFLSGICRTEGTSFDLKLAYNRNTNLIPDLFIFSQCRWQLEPFPGGLCTCSHRQYVAFHKCDNVLSFVIMSLSKEKTIYSTLKGSDVYLELNCCWTSSGSSGFSGSWAIGNFQQSI